MVWEKEVMAGLNEGAGLVNLLDYSHKTKSVAECYKPVRDLLDDDTIKDYLPDVWISLIKVPKTTPPSTTPPLTFDLSADQGGSLQGVGSLLCRHCAPTTGRHIW